MYPILPVACWTMTGCAGCAGCTGPGDCAGGWPSGTAAGEGGRKWVFEASEVLACAAGGAGAVGGGMKPEVELVEAVGGGTKPRGRLVMPGGAVGGGRKPGIVVEPGSRTISHHATSFFPSTHLPSSCWTAFCAESGDGTLNEPSKSPFVGENLSPFSTNGPQRVSRARWWRTPPGSVGGKPCRTTRGCSGVGTWRRSRST
ncbi:hypothetical protein AAT19DRAFT_11944 [Rhodotorula toruloides]|uniref:Secreted protein n=1 Tax=Rhodotorula toruloides TaxID=5286 RepID=A0A2T0AET3_RHOTO|nr:hypothetical protein AAT19DRAFT_11944 [Rhodotorula toruloides]